MATRSLSPKRAAERIQLFHSAVRTIAMMHAKNAVKANIRASGLKIAEFSARQIAEEAEQFFANHKDYLNAKAILDCLTFPEFASHRTELASLEEFAMMIVATEDCQTRVGAKLVTAAQNQSEPNSMGSAVQISGAE